MGSTSSGSLLRWLCWALVVLVVASALLAILTLPSLGILVHAAATDNVPDLVDRLAIIQTANEQALPMFVIADLAGLAVFAIATVLGVALRPFAEQGSARDVMASVFIAAGVIGVVAQLTSIAVNQAAAQGYCDCGYKAEELIGQAKALDMGFAIQDWLNIGSLVLVGLGAALAGRLIAVSGAWTTLSYGIAVAFVVAAVLYVIGQRDFGQIVSGVTAGIFVAIWAALLGRAAPRLTWQGPEAAPATPS